MWTTLHSFSLLMGATGIAEVNSGKDQIAQKLGDYTSFLRVEGGGDSGGGISPMIIQTGDWNMDIRGKEDDYRTLAEFAGWPAPSVWGFITEQTGQLWFTPGDSEGKYHGSQANNVYAWVPPQGGPLRLYKNSDKNRQEPTDKFDIIKEGDKLVLAYDNSTDGFYQCTHLDIPKMLAWYKEEPKDVQCQKVKVCIDHHGD